MTNNNKPYIIVVGNEKGGVGKTTIAMHLITNLLYDGYNVSSMDIDSRQRSLSNYLENRAKTISTKESSVNIPMPSHSIVNKSKLDSTLEGEEDEKTRFIEALNFASGKSDVVVIDAPGNDTFLSRLAHSFANTIITPINDSFVDLNLLAKVDGETFRIDRHGLYSEVVWHAKMQQAQKGIGEIDWVILRNRLSHIDAHNKRNMLIALENFSKRSGARLAEGLSERVIYKELFLKGLTLLDIMGENSDVSLTISHITARQELRNFMEFLNLAGKISPKHKEEVATQQKEQSENESIALQEAIQEKSTKNNTLNNVEQPEKLVAEAM